MFNLQGHEVQHGLVQYQKQRGALHEMFCANIALE
jgi:Zn-dependent metalloprotease